MTGLVVGLVIITICAVGFFFWIRQKKKKPDKLTKEPEVVRQYMEDVDWRNGFLLYQFMLTLSESVRQDEERLIEKVATRFRCSPNSAKSAINRLRYIMKEKLKLPPV